MADYYTDVMVDVEPEKKKVPEQKQTSSTTSSMFDILSNQTFDTKTAMSALYLWLLFGFLSTMVSCDFQRWMKDNILMRHFIGIIAFFFLFTILDKSNKTSIGIIWLKTFIVYAIFLFMIKSKWYFSLPIIILLIVDQSLKSQYSYLEQNNKDDATLPSIEKWRNNLSFLIYGVIIVGFVSYGVRQYEEFGDDFSFVKLLFHFNCKDV